MRASEFRWVAVALTLSSGLARSQAGSATGHMLAGSLAAVLQQAPANGGSITVSNQEVDGALLFGSETGTLEVLANVRLEGCHFTERVQLSDCHFHGSLTLARCKFDKGLDLSESTVDGDLVLRDPLIASPPEKAHAMVLSGVRIGGQLLISRPQVGGAIDAANVNAERLNVNLAAAKVHDLNFTGLVANGAYFVAPLQSTLDVPSLVLSNSSVKNTLSLRNLRVRTLRMLSANIGDLTQFDTVRIEDVLDLSETVLHFFRWTVAAARPSGRAWPATMNFDGMTFEDADVRLPAGAHRPDDAENIRGTGDALLCLQVAQYSQSAFQSLQDELTRRGQIPQSDEVFFAMHHANREKQWAAGAANWPWVAFDSFQEYVLGYGRSALTPFLWSCLFVLLGSFAFRKRDNMIGVEDGGKPPEFSAAWYSLELFLPVVDLGMAKAWRPSTRLLQTYARVHEIAGWVLIPVALAAITGVVR
jgi:hypothetical protein